MTPPDVAVVGGGLAGLAAARDIRASGLSPLVLEAGDEVGGRVRTDVVDGFRLDRGFQVLLAAYPETRRRLDYGALALRPFAPGARIWTKQGFTTISDPARRPLLALATLFSSAGGIRDKLRIGTLRSRARRGSLADLYARPATTTAVALAEIGFSSRMTRRFLRPFLAGVFLDPDLATSSRMLEFVFRHFAEGPACLPALGMQEIPRQLAAGLPEGSIRLGARVAAADASGVTLATGERIPARAVVIATDSTGAAALAPEISDPGWRGVRCFTFAADRAPRRGPWLYLDGTGAGPVTNLCFPSEVSPEYAPAGRTLVSASVLGGGDEAAVRAQMTEWFGPAVSAWRLLRAEEVARALPIQDPGTLHPVEKPVRLESGLFVCGDHRDTGSIQGALASGGRAAEAVIASLARAD